MEGPGLENGYTQIAHEILEEVAKHRFNGTQLRILMIVWRYTYGFKRKSHEMSVSFIATAIGVADRTVKLELKRLLDWRVLKVAESHRGVNSRKLSFNKYFNEWIEGSDSSPLSKNPVGSKTSPIEVSDSSPIEGRDLSPKIYKKNIKKEEIRDMIIPSEKIKFLDTVYLTLEQYEKLCNEFGKHRVDNTIEALDEWQTNKKPSQHKKDHNKTIRVWIKKDLEKNKASFKPKAQRNKEEMDILNQFYEEGAARETNGDGKLSGDDQDRLSIL